MEATQADKVVGFIGGVIGAIMTSISTSEIFEVLIFGLLGGFIGIIGKKLGESFWKWMTNKLSKIFKK